MIAIGCDHGGYELKLEVIKHLEEKGVQFTDCGCNGEAVDYPDIAAATCAKVLSGECDKAILICGTGIGMSMVANKYHGIRAAVCGDTFSARFTKMHNDANVICMGARVIGLGLATDIVDAYLGAEYEGGRHAIRVEMMMDVEKNQK